VGALVVLLVGALVGALVDAFGGRGRGCVSATWVRGCRGHGCRGLGCRGRRSLVRRVGTLLVVHSLMLDGRRKIISSQQQRSSNEKEIRTAARMRNKIRIALNGRSIRHVP
jgi:hypothetical protein